ncbi:CRISPR-associated protein Cas4 [Halomarina ordinaria]|uniref:PD-(D/E)XK nuclease family protein n=1 Tax=Halomarina ordinaria TaxID=3033939 RepID=A0ABD5UJ11_9EURY|nr:PD-(D/E)XK nuclease family protein [Halomarina sp. PSRA2]
MPRGDDASTAISDVVPRITGDGFREWYQQKRFRENINQGTPYFNGVRPLPPPEKHSPSRLLQCHRRHYYNLHNTPIETAPPTGIFWIGSRFEEEVVLPFLRDAVGPAWYVRNSMWIDLTISVDGEDLRIRGETDPVVVDADSTPHLLTEVKTTTSVSTLTEPKPHHRAQAHAYLYGLSEQYDCTINDALIIYAERSSFELQVFEIEFDPEFWHDRVLEWARTDTGYRSREELPPATPEFDWECRYCSYKRRCGKEKAGHEDAPPSGLLPLTDIYPRERLDEYLQAYPEARLTPTLANRYPDLATENGVYPWTCPVCGHEVPFDTVEWDGDTEATPVCPSCAENRIFSALAGPTPEYQHQLLMEEPTDERARP